ncbi:MAG TPA: class I SAM-dependent methyltransferase [Terriglobales bacterium]|nr:class I SAM-dependent methyltransferase [Terriglobales bacterium]
MSIRAVGSVVPLAPSEWCGRMWQASAVLVLRLLATLLPMGLTLSDIRPEYVLLRRGCRPVFANVGAIAATRDHAPAAALWQFAHVMLTPLFLCSIGRSGTLRRLLASGDCDAPWQTFPELAQAALAACDPGREPQACDFERIASDTAVLKLPEPATFWSGYYQRPLSIDRTESWPYKNHAVERLLSATAPESILDLAANTGWYARVGARKGARAIAVDNDETCVNRLFAAVEGADVELVPVVMDILNPSILPGPTEQQRLSARARFSAEALLALAICHHLVLSPPWLEFGEVARLLAGFTTRYLITEFVSFEPASHNPYLPSSRPGCEAWYKLEHFVTALKSRFKEVVLVPGPQGRRLVLAEK